MQNTKYFKGSDGKCYKWHVEVKEIECKPQKEYVYDKLIDKKAKIDEDIENNEKNYIDSFRKPFKELSDSYISPVYYK